MTLDFILRGAVLAAGDDPVDLGIAGGRIAAIAPRIEGDGPVRDAGGKFVCAGLVETHMHLDKAGIIGRCRICAGTLAEAVAESATAKAGFTGEDVQARGRAVLEQAIGHGTNVMRSFVEVDPRAGMRSFEALQVLQRDYAWAITLELCAFAQDGLTGEPATIAMLDQALARGAALVGGCPYTDPDPVAHVGLIFDLAQRHGVAADFHVDFDLRPEGSILPEIIAQTEARGWGGRVSVGHATKLSALPPVALRAQARRLADAGVAVTVLPATDLYLNGRDADHLVPRGVAPAHILAECGVVAAIATNNVLNPFTPYGDAALIRMANLYANVAQLGTAAEMERVFAMISTDAARLVGRTHRVAVGAAADFVLIDAPGGGAAVASIAPVLAGWRGGRLVFEHPRPALYPPGLDG